MQKLDELVQARLQEKEQQRRSTVRRDSPPQKSIRLLCRALVVMGLVLLSMVVVWACFRTVF
jgi:hypothetical protein